jgi:uncharacterized 2Fe-2S/4Fe-4S cluster protein (DUF4445 family)
MAKAELVFQPYGKRLEVEAGRTVLEVARHIGVSVSSVCGGRGLCGKCKIIVQDGESHLSAPTKAERQALSREDLKNGFRLACQAVVKGIGTITVEVPSESRVDQQKLLLKGLERKVELAPAIRRLTLSLDKPSLADAKSDVDRLVEAANSATGFKLKVDHEALKQIPHVIRKGDWTVTVTLWKNGEITAAEPGETHGLYGFAVDVGTTKLAGYLVDLVNGKIAATASMMNPQIPYGEDVISRIKFIMENPDNIAKLQQSVVEGVNQLIREACMKAKTTPANICDITVAGNTAMHHIFLGVPPNYVALMPYPAALQSSVDVKARDLALDVGYGAYVYTLPIVSGFVGGDAVADVLATGINMADELSMLIDIGTNTEIVLGNKDRLVACSCASGPAFEGAHIKHGMRASSGAIEQVWVDPETFEVGFKTVEDDKPRGLCGSGIVDVVAQLLKTGLIDRSGRLSRKVDTPRLKANAKAAEFVVAWKDETSVGNDIAVTQGDIREIQLAKAAIYTGASILMKKFGVKAYDVQRVFLAGAFGTYVDPQNAKIIGMYPDVPLERVHFIGNTAGSGARMTLLSVDARKTASDIARRVEYVELGADPDFQSEFLKATYLPHQESERFQSVSRLLGKAARAS